LTEVAKIQDGSVTIKQYIGLQISGDMTVTRRCPDEHVVEFRVSEGGGQSVTVYPLKINAAAACITCGWHE
jgi:hypothetical protein